MRRLVGDLKPDLVSFQEAIKTADYDQAADLLAPDYHVVYQSAPEPNGQSAVIASRWPIQSMREAEIHVTPRTQGFACTTLVAELAAPRPFGSLLLVNHLPNWQLDFALERELQAARAARFVEEVIGGRKVHVILAGDLTDGPDSASVRFWTGRQSIDGVSVCYRDAWASANPGQPAKPSPRETRSWLIQTGRLAGSTTSWCAVATMEVRRWPSSRAGCCSRGRLMACGPATTSAWLRSS